MTPVLILLLIVFLSRDPTPAICFRRDLDAAGRLRILVDHLHQMNYASYRDNTQCHFLMVEPRLACTSLIKQRFKGVAGMRWMDQRSCSSAAITVRTLDLST